MEMKKLRSGDELKKVQRYKVDVAMEPLTASASRYVLTGGGKLVKGGGKWNDYNDQYLEIKEHRNYLSVLARQGFTSGRSYFEVQVKGNTKWKLGVTTIPGSISDQITFRPSHGYWILTYNKDGLVFCDNPAVRLPLKAVLQKVGVFVDYDKGWLSFYDVGARVHIYTAKGCTFSKPLFPILCREY